MGRNCFHVLQCCLAVCSNRGANVEVFCNVEAFRVVWGNQRNIQRKKGREKSLNNEDSKI